MVRKKIHASCVTSWVVVVRNTLWYTPRVLVVVLRGSQLWVAIQKIRNTNRLDVLVYVPKWDTTIVLIATTPLHDANVSCDSGLSA